MNITISQIIEFLAIVAGVIVSVSTISAVFVKINDKRLEKERAAIINPLTEQLEEIKQQNEGLREQNEELRKEVILVMKLNQTMITELKEKGHVNGETTHALNELNDYLLNK